MIFARSKTTVDDPEDDEGLAAERRVANLLHAHHKFTWRCVRRFGVDLAAVDDVVQEAFIVLSRRLGEIEVGKERAFLTQTAFRLAANWRRGVRRRPATSEITEEVVAHEADGPDRRAEQGQMRRLLDRALEALNDDQRAVLILSEVDGLSRSELAELLGWSAGTVASRLRVAKARFEKEVNKLWDGSFERGRHG